MTTIWKYALEVTDTVIIAMPEGATVLTVDVQHGVPAMWVMVDPDAPLEDRAFYVRGTGHAMGEAEGFAHVGTFQLAGGSFIGHVFDAALNAR